jgi:type IV secretion system protein VirB8
MVVRTDELDDYFKKARRFDQDRYISAQRSKKLAWTVATIASGAAIVSIGAVAALAPLKTVEPFVIRVDNSTGIVDVVSALTNSAKTYDEAVTRYFGVKYVRAREAYARQTAEENFRTVSLLSSAQEQERFSQLYKGSNPQSPQVLLGQFGTARVTVKTVSMLSDKVMSIRYLKEITRGEERSVSHWIATLTFSYVNANLSTTDRYINPLGFAVTDYRNDPEVIQ